MSVQTNLDKPHRLADLGRGLVALAGVAALVAGVPFALVAWVGSPLPAGMPSLSEITSALSDTYIPDEFLIKALALVCWLVWIELAASLLVEAVAYARGRKAGAVPLAGGLQRSAARLIATVALLGAVVATKSHPQPDVRTAPSLATSTQPVISLVIDEREAAQPQPDAPTEAVPAVAAPSYQVQHRDTLWDIAERHLGDPFRWSEIFQLNQGCVQADGRCLTDPDLIFPGWQLQLPADAVGLAAPVAPETPLPAPPETPEESPADEPGGDAQAPGTTVPGTTVPGGDEDRAPDRADGQVPGDEVPGTAPDQDTPGTERPDDEVPTDEAPVDPGEFRPPSSPDEAPSSSDVPVLDGGVVLIDDGRGPSPLEESAAAEWSAPVARLSSDAASGPTRAGEQVGVRSPSLEEAAPGAPAPTSAPAPAPEQAPPALPTDVTVAPGDNLWNMAEAQLAASWGRSPTDAEVVAHWQGMVEENRDRLAPPGDPDLIYPGQVFVAPTPPSDPTGIQPLAPPAAAAPPATEVVPPAPPAPSEQAPVEVAPPAGEEAPPNDGAAPPDEEAPPASSGDEAPPIEEAPPVDEAPPIDDAGDTGTTPTDDAWGDGSSEQAAPVPGGADAPDAGAPAPGAVDEGQESAGLPVGLIGGGVATAGVLVLLERRRRAQQRHRRTGRVVPLPPLPLREGEERLRWGADIDGARLLDAALRAAAAGAGATGLPALRWVEARADAAVMVLAEPSPAPPGFVALSADRWASNLDADSLALVAARAAAPAPTLTPVGTTEHGTELLVELESAGVTTVSGPADDAVGLLRAIVVAASTAVWSDQVRVVTVGLDDDLARLGGVESVGSLADALDLAEAHAGRTEASLRSLRGPSLAQARAVGATPEAWDPLLVVAAAAPRDRGDQRRLDALAERHNSAVGLVTLPGLDDGGPGRSFAIGTHGWLEIEGVDEPVRPRYLGRDDARALVELLEEATARVDEAPGGAVVAFAPRRPMPPPPPPAPLVEAPPSGEPGSSSSVETGSSSSVETGSLAEAAAGADLRPGSPGPVVTPRPSGSAGSSSDPSSSASGGARRPGARPSAAGSPPPSDPRSDHPARRGARLRLGDLIGEVDVLVRVLGEVEAVRLDRSGDAVTEARLVPTRQRALEAIAYLALRESAVDREDLEISLFPHGANAAKTVYNTISAARTLVGDTLFPPPEAGRYELSPAVVTDYGIFCEMAATADETDDAEMAADLLTDALTLVRGEPFTGAGRGYAWVGPHRGMIVAQVVDVAEELAEVRLAMGDWRAAEWAARQGLRAFPSDERMYRLLMRTARAAGNIPGVQRTFRELCDVLADPDIGVEPEDTVHPETIELLEELTGTMPRQGRKGA